MASSWSVTLRVRMMRSRLLVLLVHGGRGHAISGASTGAVVANRGMRRQVNYRGAQATARPSFTRAINNGVSALCSMI